MATKEQATEALQNGTTHEDVLAISTVNPAYLKLAQSKLVRQRYIKIILEKNRS